MEKPEAQEITFITGDLVEVGDDEDGSPRLIVSSTRAAIKACIVNMIFKPVVVMPLDRLQKEPAAFFVSADGTITRAYPTVFDEVIAERKRQDEQWGGPDHDDGHDCIDWCNWIDYQRQRAVGSALAGDRADWRERMVKIAALAVAAIESHDRVMVRSAEASP